MKEMNFNIVSISIKMQTKQKYKQDLSTFLMTKFI